MTDLIRLLPDAIANKIAAGEVVQRPASVLKELVENAVDAGASKIQVIIKDSGKTLVQVIDDGKGMSPADARMSFERHATSKLRTADDLFAVETMGFRGEALASIAAVAQVEMKTRREVDELATQIQIEGSKVIKQEPCQAPQGTSIAVKNLFFNVPARRKFLKSDPVEFRHLNDEFMHIALAYPNIAFSMHHNDQEIYFLPRANLRQRAVGVMGKRHNEHLVPVSEVTNYLRIEGFIGKPDIAKKSRGDQYLFVNNRFIKSPYLHHAIVSAYKDVLPEKTHPFYMLFLDIDPSRVDVNVHPTKQEIKFEDERLIYNYLRVAARHALGKYSITPTLDFEQNPLFQPGYSGGPSGPVQRRQDPLSQPNLKNWDRLFDGLTTGKEGERDTITLPSEIFPETQESEREKETTREFPYHLHNTLLISQIKSGMVVVDQQAAHERILFERFLAAQSGKQRTVQKVLFPVTIELQAGEGAIIAQVLPHINAMGFEIEDFGNNTLIVHGIPAEMPDKSLQASIRDILDSILENRSPNDDLGERVARALAIHASVKRGEYIAPEERRELMDLLFACENPYKSPSGRKCFVVLELEELMKRFK